GVEFGYATDLFDEPTVAAIFALFVRVLRGIVADPGLPVGDLPLLGPDELAGLAARDTGPALPQGDSTIAELFAHQVTTTPELPAVIDAESGEVLTYRAFAEEVNALARVLIGRGVGPGSLVAVSMPRSVDLLRTLYAIHAAGAAYLPLDPEHPVDRVRAVLTAAVPDAVLVRDDLDIPTDAPVWHLAELTGTTGSTAP